MENLALNKIMVDGQIKPINGISNELVNVFYSLDRNSFMPRSLSAMSYVEKNLIIDDNRAILKPELVAKIALYIDLKSNENVLVIGATTGYLTAVLAHQAETVIVVEEIDSLLNQSEDSIKENNINNVVFFKGEMVKGCIDQSPFNAIIIEGAVNDVPEDLLSQLDEEGRLLAIVSENDICSARLYRKKDNYFDEEKLFNCILPTLNSFKNKNSFSF